MDPTEIQNTDKLFRVLLDWVQFFWQESVCWILGMRSGSNIANNCGGALITESLGEGGEWWIWGILLLYQ